MVAPTSAGLPNLLLGLMGYAAKPRFPAGPLKMYQT